MNSRWSQLALASAAFGASLFLYKKIAGRRTFLSPEVAGKVPLVKDLETIPDQVGNYDLDGASFDDEGVVVASDNSKHLVAPV